MLSRVKQWLVEHAGLEPELLQRDWLDRLIQRRLSQLEVPSADSYCRLLERDPAERDRIIREVCVGETCFFRYPASYDLLVQQLRRRREASGRRSALRLLSVACATGEEPYSMAISAVHAGWPLAAVTVDAVDRDADALAVARQGRYSWHPSRQQLPAWTSPWLRVEDNQLRVAPGIQAAVNFLYADAVAAPDSVPAGPYAIVFCRNLLVYLHAEARNRLADNLAHWLESGGLLFVGHAEQLESLRSRFRMVPHPGAFALRPMEATSAAAPGQGVTRVAPSRGQMGSDRSPRPARGCEKIHVGESLRDSLPVSERPADFSLLERARTAADQGHLDQALTDLRAALQSSAPAAELYQLLGSIQLSQGRLPEAREALRRAVYLDPGHEESLLQLAIVYQGLGDERAGHTISPTCGSGPPEKDGRIRDMSTADAVSRTRPIPDTGRSGAMSRLLDRPLDDEDVRAATLRVEQPLTVAGGELVTLLVFRVDDELLGLPAADVGRVSLVAPVHRIPHRSNAVVRGLCDVEGELLICVSLSAILELGGPEATDAAAPPDPAGRRRMVVIGRRAESWAVVVEEVLGMRRLEAKTFLPPPVTVQKARQCYTRSLAPLEDGRTVAVLDASRLDASFKAALS